MFSGGHLHERSEEKEASVNLEALMEKRRLLICCGSGGVGKTTTAAALAVKAAMIGKKAAVLTIDPARRLANSLGLKDLENEERQVALSEFAKFDLKPKGELFALMLDTKRTFDKIIERYSGNEETKNAVLQNKLYQHLSNMIAGSQEYMAMEKVYELYEKKDYDLLVLDTPPTQHALDFLEAPQKMIHAVTDSMLKWFLKPGIFMGRTGLRILEKGARKILKVFDSVTGFEFLQDLSAMLISTAGLLEFKERAQQVSSLLRNSKTAFLLVSSHQSMVLSEALSFLQKILELKLPFEGFVVNRVHLNQGFTKNLPAMLKGIKDLSLANSKREALSQILKSYGALVEQDQSQLKLLKDKVESKDQLTLVPHLESDVHDLQGLAELGKYL
jgi:anion-transporting  ArsA/GET3 family ATPase